MAKAKFRWVNMRTGCMHRLDCKWLAAGPMAKHGGTPPPNYQQLPKPEAKAASTRRCSYCCV